MVVPTLSFWLSAFGPLMLAALLIGGLTGARVHRLRARTRVNQPFDD